MAIACFIRITFFPSTSIKISYCAEPDGSFKIIFREKSREQQSVPVADVKQEPKEAKDQEKHTKLKAWLDVFIVPYNLSTFKPSKLNDTKKTLDKNLEKQDEPIESDIIYRKSTDFAKNVAFEESFTRGDFHYYALDKSKNNITGKAWNDYMLKSMNVEEKEFLTMRGDQQ